MTDDSATLLEIRDLLREILVELRAERPATPPKRSRRKAPPPVEVDDLARARATRILRGLGMR